MNDLEKTGGISELYHCLQMVPFFDEDRLLYYLELYGKQFLYQKAGFILEALNCDLTAKVCVLRSIFSTFPCAIWHIIAKLKVCFNANIALVLTSKQSEWLFEALSAKDIEKFTQVGIKRRNQHWCFGSSHVAMR